MALGREGRHSMGCSTSARRRAKQRPLARDQRVSTCMRMQSRGAMRTSHCQPLPLLALQLMR